MSSRHPYRKPTIPEKAQKVFDGVIFDVYQWEQELYDGSKTTFEKAARSDTVVVFPILDDGRILLIEDEQPVQKKLLTAVAGRVDPGETPDEAVRREMLEETGYAADRYELISEVQPILKVDWTVYTYIARGCKKVKEPDPGPGEIITPKPMTLDELLDAGIGRDLAGGEFRIMLLEAKLDPGKMSALRKLFSNT